MKLLTDSISVCVIYIKNNIMLKLHKIIVKANMYSLFFTLELGYCNYNIDR